MSSESKIIILYPRTYNQRGVESLHSVEGLTHDGRLVNIKLRVQGNVRMAEATPSISRFAKRDIRESKLSCLASEDNGPNNPSGILVFTDCEEDTNNRKSVVSYISRWAQILRSGHNAGAYGSSGDLPFIGLGRLFIDKETKKIKRLVRAYSFLKRQSLMNGRMRFSEMRPSSMTIRVLISISLGISMTKNNSLAKGMRKVCSRS